MSTAETGEASKALVRAHYDAMINRFDPEALRAQLASDFVDHQAGRAMTAEEVIAHGRRLHAAFADLAVTLDDMVAEGNRVAVRATWRGVHQGEYAGIPATGKRSTFTGMVFWRVRDGKIAERWAEIDGAKLAASLRA